MRTLSVKKTVIVLLSVIAMLCMSMSAIFSVRADEVTKPDVADNMYAQGAHVDMATDGSEFYITFHNYLTSDLLSWLNETESAVKVGALIGPASLYSAEDTYESLLADTFRNVCYLGNSASDALQKTNDLVVSGGIAEFTSSVRYNVNQLKIDAANGSFDVDKNGAIDDDELATMLSAITSVNLIAVPYVETVEVGYELGTVNSGARNAKFMLNDATINGTIDKSKYSEIFDMFVGETTDDTAEYVVDVDGNVWKADENGDLVKDTETEYLAYAGRGINESMELSNLTEGNTYGLVKVEDGALVNAKAKLVTKVLTTYDDFKVFAYTADEVTKITNSSSLASVDVEKDGYYVMASDVNMGNQSIGGTVNVTFGACNPQMSAISGGFVGTLDGRGKIISNLYSSYGGLFTLLRGTVKDVAIVDATINSANYGGLFGLAVNGATIENVFISIKKTNLSNAGHIGLAFGYKVDGTTFNNVVVYGSEITPSGTGYINRFMDFSFYNNGASNTFTNYYSIGDGQFGYFKKDATTYYTLWDTIAHGNETSLTITGTEIPYLKQIDTYFGKSGSGVTKVEQFNIGAKKFESYANMSKANLNLTSFNDCWDTTGGVPVWKTLPLSIVVTDTNDNENFTLSNSITFKAKYKAPNEDDYTDVAVSKINVKTNDGYVTVNGATVNKSNKLVTEPVTVNADVVTSVGTVNVNIVINPPASVKLNTDHEIYVQEDGAVVGLTASDLAVVGDANTTLYDGGATLTYSNGVLSGLASGKSVGTEYGFTAITSDTIYEVKYLYVTKAITDEEGLKAMKCTVTDNKPSSRVEGYYVLANNIIASGTGYGYGLDGKDFRSTAGTNGFAGTFDGRGHTISNLYAFRGGLFLHVNGGTIKNVAFINCTMNFKQDGFLALTATKMTVEDVYVQIIPKAKGHTNNYISGAMVWQHTNCSFTRVVVENNSLSIPSVDGNTVYSNVASFGVNVDFTKTAFVDCISIGRGLFVSNDVSSTTSLNVIVDKNWTTNNSITIGSANVLADMTNKLVSGGTGSYAVKNMPITTLFGSATTRPNIYFLNISGATHYGDYDSMKADTTYDYTNFAKSTYWSVSATRELSWNTAK